MKNIKIISSALVTFILVSCQKNSVEPIENHPLIPLNVGNYWLYQDYDLDPETGDYRSSGLWKFGFIIQNSPQKSTIKLNSTTYKMSRCDEYLTPIDDTGFTLYGGNKLVYQDKSGFYYSGIARGDTILMTFNDLIFPYPAAKGKWVNGHVFYYNNSGNTSNVSDEVTTQYVCVTTDSLFTTPLGSFRCIVYRMAWQDFKPLFRDEVYYFIKPSLGIVGMVTMVYNYKTSKYRYMMKYVLTDYKVK